MRHQDCGQVLDEGININTPVRPGHPSTKRSRAHYGGGA